MLTLDEQIARLADHAEQAAIAATAAASESVVVRFDDRRRSPHRRPWLLAAAASVVAIGLAAVALVPRWAEPEPPAATVPPVPTTAPPSIPPSTLPTTEPPQPVWSGPRPTVFPALPEGDPRNRSAEPVSGYRSIGSIDRSVASSASLVGRVVGDELVEGAMVQVLESPIDLGSGFHEVDPVTVAGRIYDAWRADGGSPVQTTLVDRDDPRIRVSGVDPVGFLGLLGSPPTTRIDVSDGVVDVELAELPTGWTMIVPPAPAPPRTLIAQLILQSSDSPEGDFVGVGMIPELPFVGSSVPMRRVDVNGTEGWMTQEAAFAVYWAAGDGTFALAVVATADGALELARAIEFVDEATWRERYDVGPEDMAVAGPA